MKQLCLKGLVAKPRNFNLISSECSSVVIILLPNKRVMYHYANHITTDRNLPPVLYIRKV